MVTSESSYIERKTIKDGLSSFGFFVSGVDDIEHWNIEKTESYKAKLLNLIEKKEIFLRELKEKVQNF